MKTFTVKPADIKKKWVVVDATGKTLGRLATEIAIVLRGKNKPTFTPNYDCGDNVIVTNAAAIKLTGKKMDDKIYYHHTRYIGGIKAASAGLLLSTYPERVITSAVKGMLPHNKLGRSLHNNLRVYGGAEHPHGPQNPVPMTTRTAGVAPKRS